MAARTTIRWLTAALLLASSLSAYLAWSLRERAPVDTEAMLDVSVSVRTLSHVTTDRLGDSVWSSGTGSGFLVSRERCEVWTNHHVIEDAARVEVFPRGWTHAAGIPARVLGATPRPDLAILVMDRCDGIPAARLGSSASVRPGDETYAVGNPLGRNPDSITRGIISHTERYLYGAIPHLQTDASINPGSSGGALFNREGRVIGINTAIASSAEGANTGIGYAVPIDQVRSVAARLREGPPSWGDAGIEEMVGKLSPDEAEVFKVPAGHGGIILTATPEKGPGAGKLRARDVIYAIGEEQITDPEQALRALGRHRAGETVALHLVREGEVTVVRVTLQEGWNAGDRHEAEPYDGLLGMTLEMWDEREDDFGHFRNPVITRVQSLGPAHLAHIASSQRGAVSNGAFLMPYQLDVKTVTGLAFQGMYHPVRTVETLEEFARLAWESGAALLLEIEVWMRPDPRAFNAPMERLGTAFFRVVPHPAEIPDPGPRLETAGRPAEHHADAGPALNLTRAE